ncbi:MAG: hypothetical protein CMH62_01305 [Nanoarchaeota archaeon]|nr:hypothetical protein [Nanoarchaeota archaeon]|tara:strand:- start:2011 stop:2244 length:234 start_codon:yes stop_codon:yes gene_type:complete
MNPNYGLMIELKPEFQRELFTKLLRQYKRFPLAKLLKRTSSLIYHYKNCRVRGLSIVVATKAIELADISKRELEKTQ